jgi:hypothetical protein
LTVMVFPRLSACLAICEFAQDVQMACMPSGLLNHVGERPAHRRTALAFGRSWCGRAEIIACSNDAVRAGNRILVGSYERFNGFIGASVKCRRPVGDPLTKKHVPLDVGEMFQKPKQIGAGADTGCSNQRFRDILDLAYHAHTQVVEEADKDILFRQTGPWWRRVAASPLRH